MNTAKRYYWLILIIACNMFSLQAIAQTLSATVDREKIVIGEQIKLLLKVDNAASVADWFSFPDSVNHLEVVERGKIDTISIDNILAYQQTITLTSFDSGQWQIPALQLSSANKAAPTSPITIDVLPVDVSALKDYHDIKEIVEVQMANDPLIIIIIAVLTLVSLFGWYWFMRVKKKAVISKSVLKGNQTPLAWALLELEKLQQENLLVNNLVKQHYQQLIHISRQYFYLQLKHQSLHQTTDEWMLRLQDLPVAAEVKTSFMQLLRLADIVKFAKYLPPTQQNAQSIADARQMFEQVNASHQSFISSPKSVKA